MQKVNDIDNITLPVYKRLKKVIDKIIPQLGNINVDDLPYIESIDTLTIEDINKIKGKCFRNFYYIYYPLGILGKILLYFRIGTNTNLYLFSINYSNESNIVLTELVDFPLKDLKDITANPTLVGTESKLNGLQIGNTKYKVFNPDDSGLFVTDNMQYGYDGEINKYFARFSRTLTSQEYNRIPASGLAIIMFNTTCVCIPYVKNQENRFICNAICDNNGVSMAARGNLTINETLSIQFDENYAQAVNTNMMNQPYCVIRFLGI